MLINIFLSINMGLTESKANELISDYTTNNGYITGIDDFTVKATF